MPKPGVDRHEARGWLLDGLAEVVTHAECAGVVPAFEPEPGMLVETPAEFEALDIEGLALALDTGHCLVTQEIERPPPSGAGRRGSARSRSRT